MKKSARPVRRPGRTRQMAWRGALVAGILAGTPGAGHAADVPPGAAIQQQLRSFATTGSVLYVAAHPDDENTQVIAYLARGRGYRTAYLSLTRGDGGQNLLGPELREQLGVARTQELLAARRIDGGRQYFSRANDFGYSKDFQETLQIWDRQAVLSDIVRVIRAFRPDVVITRFSPDPGPTHGHHTASVVLAVEAFKQAGDPRAFPEQLRELTPWQPTRILHNIFLGGPGTGPGGPGAGAVRESDADLLKIDIGGTDPVTRESFAAMAARSRGMHRTQGFGQESPAVAGGSRIERFRLLGGEPATRDLLDGVDTTWNRIAGGAEIGRMTEAVIAQFDPNNPAASVPALLAIRRRLAALSPDPLVIDKRKQLDDIIRACAGLEVETTVAQPEIVPGETLHMRHTVVVRSQFPVRWTAVRYPSVRRTVSRVSEPRPDRPVVWRETQVLPAGTPPSQPYWLRKDGTPGLFRVDDPALIGLPENPPAFPIEYVFKLGGQTMVVSGEPVAAGDPAKPAIQRRLEVVPPASIRFVSGVRLFAPGEAREITVELTAARPRVTGTVELETPAGWKASPATQPFRLATPGETARFTFTVSAPSELAAARLGASIKVHGARFDNQRIELHYAHIPFQLLQPAAAMKAVSLELATRGRRVGYIPGAGDEVPAGLEQMGYAVTTLDSTTLTPEALKALDAVVIGIRAFNTRKDLPEHLPALYAYVEAGGTVIAQYNQLDGLKPDFLSPFRLRISRDRVTDEHAPVTLLAPGHPVLNTPNRITPADFDGWVQERGLYFPDQWDDRFTPILAASDPGEKPLQGGLLVARYGKGYLVYTSLSWFRQLPEGVPGAYRLFANLVSLGQ